MPPIIHWILITCFASHSSTMSIMAALEFTNQFLFTFFFCQVFSDHFLIIHETSLIIHGSIIIHSSKINQDTLLWPGVPGLIFNIFLAWGRSVSLWYKLANLTTSQAVLLSLASWLYHVEPNTYWPRPSQDVAVIQCQSIIWNCMGEKCAKFRHTVFHWLVWWCVKFVHTLL